MLPPEPIGAAFGSRCRPGERANDSLRVARWLHIVRIRPATFPPIRVRPEVSAQVEAVWCGGQSLTQFIEEAVVAAAAWRRVQPEFVTRG